MDFVGTGESQFKCSTNYKFAMDLMQTLSKSRNNFIQESFSQSLENWFPQNEWIHSCMGEHNVS